MERHEKDTCPNGRKRTWSEMSNVGDDDADTESETDAVEEESEEDESEGVTSKESEGESEEESEGEDVEEEDGLDPWESIVLETYEIMQKRFDRRVKAHVDDGESLKSAELSTASELRSDYERTLRDVYVRRLLLNRALQRDPVHEKLAETARRLRDEDQFDREESLKYAVRKRRHLLGKKLDDYLRPKSTLVVDERPDVYEARGATPWIPVNL
jgi:hypothetical protein